MKFVSLIALFVALLFALFVASLSAGAQQENVPSVSKRIQRTYWKGEFRGEAFGGLVECAGPIDVWFFKMKPESFSQGVSTISYRHKVDASNSSWLCQALVGALSPISMDECEPDFPRKRPHVKAIGWCPIARSFLWRAAIRPSSARHLATISLIK
jgi:hypothetical protein